MLLQRMLLTQATPVEERYIIYDRGRKRNYKTAICNSLPRSQTKEHDRLGFGGVGTGERWIVVVKVQVHS